MRAREALLGVVLLATLAGTGYSLRLPTPPPATVAEVAPAPPPAAPERPPPGEEALRRRLWRRLASVRGEGAVCDRRPLPPVGELRASPALDASAAALAAALAGGETPDPPEARAREAGFRGRLVGELTGRGASPDEVVAAWLDAAGTCGPLLAPDALRAGVAIVPDPAGGFVWAVVLGAR